MSVYDNRAKPAYRSPWELEHSDNHYILKWWTPCHDDLIPPLIAKHQWNWFWFVTDEVVRITPPEIIEAWQSEDPLCKRWAWYNILMNFAGARAQKLGMTEAIREPLWKTCALCHQPFNEASLPVPLISRLGIDQLDFCAPCLKDTVLQGTGSETLSKEDVLAYLRDLTSVLQRIPNQGFGEGMNDLADLSTEDRVTMLRLLKKKPTVRHVKELFGSWFHALVEAGILEDGTRRMVRGTHCLANDGHVCHSLAEKTIDDFLYFHGIPHEREPKYPEGNYRGDFEVEGVLIEYFGLTGNPDYDNKTKLKQNLCRKHGIKLISLYPEDLTSSKKLERKLLKALDQDAKHTRS